MAPFPVGMWNAEKGQDGEDEGTRQGNDEKVLSGKRARFAKGMDSPWLPNTFVPRREEQKAQKFRSPKCRAKYPRLVRPLADEVGNLFLEYFFFILENLPSKQHSNQ